MLKNYRKFIAGFALFSLLLVVSGFCYVPEVKASGKPVKTLHLVEGNNQECNQEKQKTTVENIYSQKAVPISKNAVKPCCLDRHDKMPVNLTSNFSGISEIFLSQNQIADTVEISSTQNTSNISSDNSPPKPDKLSSVLRLE